METIKRGRGRPIGTHTKIIPTHRDGKKIRVYRTYIGMVRRCTNPKSHIWKYYGGRGIRVCERWLGPEGFNNFVCDMGEPLPGMSLDRINNDGNYEPSNCRWATMKEQGMNKRHCKVRKPGCLRQKCLAAGMPYHLVYFRIKRFGWTEEAALSTPIQPKGRRVGFTKEQFKTVR